MKKNLKKSIKKQDYKKVSLYGAAETGNNCTCGGKNCTCNSNNCSC